MRPRIQEALDALGFARNDLQIGLRWLVRFRAALLPVPESAQRDVVAGSEFLLRQGQGAANDFRLRRPLHPLKIAGGQRLRVAVGASSRFDGLGRHGPKRFAGSSRLAHIVLRQPSKRRGPSPSAPLRVRMTS